MLLLVKHLFYEGDAQEVRELLSSFSCRLIFPLGVHLSVALILVLTCHLPLVCLPGL